MTNEDKIKVLAELDGWANIAAYHCNGPLWGTALDGRLMQVRPYLTSYDAIIPLFQKQPSHIKAWTEKALGLEYWVAAVMATPEQLCDALIKAVGKWKE